MVCFRTGDVPDFSCWRHHPHELVVCRFCGLKQLAHPCLFPPQECHKPFVVAARGLSQHCVDAVNELFEGEPRQQVLICGRGISTLRKGFSKPGSPNGDQQFPISVLADDLASQDISVGESNDVSSSPEGNRSGLPSEYEKQPVPDQ
jgi:hypothetical protein